MKKNALVIAGLTLLSTNAFASKARIESFGTNANHYIKDSRNMFRNAATVNSNTNMVITEWGTSQSGDSDATPRAEGGFFRQSGALNYGLYLGNNSTDGRDNRDYANAGTNVDPVYQAQDNALDLFVGGDAGMQWGARLHYANSKNTLGVAEELKNTAYGLGLGVIMGQADVYANVTIADKSTGMSKMVGTADTYLDNSEVKTKPSFEIGGSYDLDGTTFFAEIAMGKTENTDKSAATVVVKENKTSEYLVGAGRVMELSPTARVFGNAAFEFSKLEEKIRGEGETKKMMLPVAFGFEADATSWLTLRGSIGQNIVLNSKENKSIATNTVASQTTKSTNLNTTEVTAGASLTFDKLSIDGYMGSVGTGVLNTTNLLSRIGVTYNF